jgi:hypothetical protein
VVACDSSEAVNAFLVDGQPIADTNRGAFLAEQIVRRSEY